MKATIFASAALLTALSGTLPAVDSQLLNLVMPDAKVLAGVNVAQAKGSPFGQYVLSQISAGNDGLAQMASVTGFDPSRDVNELLLASNGATGTHSGLATATGTFDVTSIAAFATGHGGDFGNLLRRDHSGRSETDARRRVSERFAGGGGRHRRRQGGHRPARQPVHSAGRPGHPGAAIERR